MVHLCSAEASSGSLPLPHHALTHSRVIMRGQVKLLQNLIQQGGGTRSYYLFLRVTLTWVAPLPPVTLLGSSLEAEPEDQVGIERSVLKRSP